MIEGNLGIIQYNCGLANHGATRPLFDAVSPETHYILAIQEPAYRKLTRSTYCPAGYTLAYEANPTTKVCFMISKHISTAHWSAQQHSQDVASLRLLTARGPLLVINVYNPRGNNPRIGTWETVRKALSLAEGNIILLGDFNAHHPAWGGVQAASEPQAEHLLLEAARHNLHLLTPAGEPTWKRGRLESVIDLTFATSEIQTSLIHCGPRDSWATTQDHIPIDIRLNLALPPKPESRRYALQKLDTTGLAAHVRDSRWWQQEDPLSHLQATLEEGLPKLCPKAKPSPFAKRNWSPRASELLAGARRARRTYNASGQGHDLVAFKTQQNLLKKEMRRASRSSWRKFLASLSTGPATTRGKGLWRIARWSKHTTGEKHTEQSIPPLRRNDTEPLHPDNNTKAQILAERFFPPSGEADLRDIACETRATSTLDIPSTVTTETIEKTLKGLPNNKAPGPDGIPNEILKKLAPEFSAHLAHAASSYLAQGKIPTTFKESTTVVLRKDKKKDYTLPGSYRPVALENTIAKLLEKIVADRMAEAAEAHNLLPWNQMGARKKRSTETAIELMQASIQTAWKARPGCIVSMLSLDLSGAFDNVSHERLLAIIRAKGFPTWISGFVHSFLEDRKTKIAFPGYQSPWIHTKSGIPQGSPLSPILFLFFISELLAEFMRADSGSLAYGFVDDTNLITWGDTAESNCRKLEGIHDRCVAWARRHGAKFAPDKYQLIHFTRRKRDAREDLASPIRIGDHEIKPNTTLRVLGVWVDRKLQWKEQIKRAADKGQAAYEALSRITASTWGPSMRKSRLLYTAVVRPALAYGASAWAIRDNGEPATTSLLKPLRNVQNKCLRKATGAYKRTPTAALEREADVPPFSLYTDAITLRKAIKTGEHPVSKEIARAADEIWDSIQTTNTPQGRGRPPNKRQTRPPVGSERLRLRATERVEEIQGYEDHLRNDGRSQHTRRRRAGGGARQHPPAVKHKTKLINKWADLTWRQRWKKTANNKEATTWKTPWETRPTSLYKGLPKHQATALFLLRTEVIGLNAWLSSVGVPGTVPRCLCGWHAQTVRHILLHCPQHATARPSLIREAGTEDLQAMLTRPASAKAAARWFIRTGLLQQFQVAANIESEDLAQYHPLEEPEEWE